MRKTLACVALSLLFFSCTKKTDCGCVVPYQVYYLKAKVSMTSDFACGKPLLDFTEDLARVRLLANSDMPLYTVTTLSQDLNIVGKKLYVSVIVPKPDEILPCNMMDISYVPLKLLDAKPRD